MSEITRLRSPKKTLEEDRQIGQSEVFLSRQVHRTVQSAASKKKRQGSLLVQSDSSGRTTSQTPRQTDKLLRLSQSKAFGASFGRTTIQYLRIDQSHPLDGSSFGRIFVLTNHILRTDHPSDGLPSRPITSLGRIILWTDLLIDQSHPSDGSSFGRTFVSTNHILRNDHPSDGLLYRSITVVTR